MADIADQADKNVRIEVDAELERISRLANNIPEGDTGVCEYCGHYFTRLVNGACGHCRDELGME